MKKLLTLIILSITLSSCYEDYVKDFDFNAVFFPYQINVRSVVVGEGLKIKVGAELGGVLKNTQNREVSFILDNNLITPEVLESMKASSLTHISKPVSSLTELKPMPSSYYTMSNPNTFIIKKGDHQGMITIEVDSTAFLGDSLTITPIYALPFYITGADADSILATKRTAIIAVKYENMLFGNYLHGGVTIIKDPSNNIVETITYPTYISQPEDKIWMLKTVAPNAIVTNGYSDKTSVSKQELLLTLNGTNINISSASGSTYVFEPDGSSTYNAAKLLQKRQIFLKYKYINEDGNTCYAQDTLTFRNRLRDGVNEWQDENPSNYD